MAVENEYKFTSDRGDASACLSELESFLQGTGKEYAVSTKLSTDYYYDSVKMEITLSGCFIRKRVYSDGKCKLTVKRPISADGIMSREEIERTSDGSYQGLQSFCDECFPGVVLNDDPSLINRCERTVFTLDDGSGAKLSFDMCQYAFGDRRKDYLEIEYEIVSDAVKREFDDIGLVDFVTRSLRFVPVTESKYTRGLKWIAGE